MLYLYKQTENAPTCRFNYDVDGRRRSAFAAGRAEQLSEN